MAGAPASYLEDGARAAPSCGRGQAAGGKDAAELESGGTKFPRMRQQRTLRQTIGCAGVGLHSGARVAVTLRPAAEGAGIRFRRVDRPGTATIAARPWHASAQSGATCLTGAGGVSVMMVEHLLAALAVCQVDNILVELSGPELPAMDGSALPFVRLIECAGTISQRPPVARLELLHTVEARSAGGYVRLEPAGELLLALGDVDPAAPPVFALPVTAQACRQELVAARAGDVATTASARHTMLDALGCLALLPAQIVGRYVEHGANAALRCTLLHALISDRTAFCLTGLHIEALVPRADCALSLAS